MGFIAICFLLASFNSNGEESRGYEIEGNVIFSGKPLKEPYTGTFSMRVDGCNWNIRIKRALPDAPDYTEIGWDGTNLFSVTSMESNYKKLTKEGKKIVNVATAYLGKDEIYRSVFDPEFAMIWLTYGSKCYFDNKKQGDFLEPVIAYDSHGAIERRSKTPLYRSAWKRQGQFPFLPTEVIYLEAQSHFNTFTNSLFQVTSFTSYEGQEYPKTATLETYQFLQQSNSTTTDLNLFSKYELNLTAIHNITTPHFTPRPTLPGPTDFIDERIPEVGQITYFNSNWIAESNLVGSQGFKSRVNTKNYSDNFLISDNQSAWKRKFILAVFIILSLVPLLILIKTYINKNKK
jgi:hypothetical protein